MANRLPLPTALKWKLALYGELLFWEKRLKKQVSEMPDIIDNRFNPNLEIQPYVSELIDEGIEDVKILDVGAGPLTILGKHWKGKKISISAIDPLADGYNKILDKLGVEPLVKTTFAHAENLIELFPENHFHFVHANNSIDHCLDPLLAIRQMLAVVKPGCFVFMWHKLNEGENEKYRGLHQWNFYFEGENFFINNRKNKIKVNVTGELKDVAEVFTMVSDDNIVNRIKKR